MTTKTDLAERHLAFFSKTRLAEHLQDAIETLEGIEPSEIGPPPAETMNRREVFKAWSNVLAVIDDSIDPKFNRDDIPAMNLIPPPSGGATFPAGVDPRALGDPDARAEYEAALKRNREKAQYYNYQTQLRVCDEVSLDNNRRIRIRELLK